MEASTQEDYWEKFLDAYANQTPLRRRRNSGSTPTTCPPSRPRCPPHVAQSDYLEQPDSSDGVHGGRG
jgi:hypothetical protein